MAIYDFIFPRFSLPPTELLRCNRDAAIIEGALRLTPRDSSAVGSCWYREPVTFRDGFETSFTFKISEPLESGADGFAFVLQNDPRGAAAFGSDGQGLGYSGIVKSVAVIFDTFDNSFGSGSSNRVGVNLDGDVSESGIASLPLSAPDLSQGEHFVNVRLSPPTSSKDDTRIKPHRVPISGSGSTRDLSVHLDGEHLLTVRVDVSRISPEFQGYVGFTAATGGHGENHDILSWSYNANREGLL